MARLAIPKIPLSVAIDTANTISWLAHRADAVQRPESNHVAHSVLAASAMPMTLNLAQEISVPQEPPAVAGDKFDELVKMMNAAAKPPAEQVASGVAPVSTVVTLKPEDSALGSERKQAYLANKGMLSLAQLYTGILDISNRKKRGHPEPYKISDPVEALQAYADQADTAYTAMTVPLAGFYIFTTGDAQHFKKTYNRGEFHLGFLGVLFSGFDISNDVMGSLDKILTNFAQAVGSFKFEETSESKEVSHCVKINTTPGVNITGDVNDKEMVYEPTTHILYLKIQAKAWTAAVSGSVGSSRSEHIDFEMTWTSTKCQLNLDWYQKSKPKFDKIMEFVTGKNLEAFGAKLDNEVEETKMN